MTKYSPSLTASDRAIYAASVLEVRGYGRLLGDEEVEEGAVVEDTTAGEGLLVSVVASPIRVRLDARVAVRGGLVMDAQDEVVVDGGLEVSKYANQGHLVLFACTMGELRQIQVLHSEQDV